jgi:hypothetical protein
MPTPHEDPATPYEMMLDMTETDCSCYGCWSPAAALVFGDPRWPEGNRACAQHAEALAAEFVITWQATPRIEWLES